MKEEKNGENFFVIDNLQENEKQKKDNIEIEEKVENKNNNSKTAKNEKKEKIKPKVEDKTIEIKIEKEDKIIEDKKIEVKANETEKVEEKECETEEKKDKKEKIGIKIPWWIGYTILFVVFILSAFLVYKAFNPGFTIETFSNMDFFEFNISCDKQEIEIGEKLEIKINKYNNKVILQSSNPEIISVSNNTITGIKEGEATIYATKGEEKSNELTLKCIIGLQEITINKTSLELLIEKEEQLTASLVPENTTYKELIWKSSNEDIATVADGLVKGISEGKATITVSNLQETKVATCIVDVKPIEVKSITLDDSSINLGIGQNYILRSIVSPNNATNSNVIWESSNSGVISVDNGKIKAISTGQAKVTAMTKNGKKATCSFTVSSSNPSNTIKYVSNDFNVRIGPGTSYQLLGSVSRNDEIEILKEEKSWTKLRILKNGIVGYTISKDYSLSKTYYIENVPYINQFNLGYPTGCEAVSATMAAKYAGYNVSAATIIANTPTDELGKREETRTKEVQTEVLSEETGLKEIVTTTEQETIWVGGNPFKVFVGHPTKGLSAGSYGCFAAPIVTALNSSGVSCTNISGCSIDTVFSYIAQGKPVVVWCKKNAGDLIEGVTWKYPDESGEFLELKGEHCAVLIGYDGEYVYLNDPSAGKGVKQAKWKFTSNWYKLYSQAIIIN